MGKKNQSEIIESRNTKPSQHPALAKPAWYTGTRREFRGGLLAAAEFLITFSRKGEPPRAVTRLRIAGMSHSAACFCRFGVEVGFVCSFRRSFVFSEGIYTARLEKEPRLEKGRVRVPAGGAGRGCEMSARRRRGSRRSGSALGVTERPAHPAARGEAAPAEVCMDCTDLAGNVRSALFVWTSPRDSSPSSRPKLLVG